MDEQRPEAGTSQVDGVLDSLDALAQLPIAEHAAVFETAHQRLREALASGAAPAGRPTA